MRKLFLLLLTIFVAGASVKAMASDVSPGIPKMNGMVVSSSSGSVTPGLWTLPSADGEAWSMNFEMNPGYATFYSGVLYDDVYYATRCNAQYGSPIIYVDAYSMEDGKKMWTNYPKLTALPYDLAYNPYDGKIYGFFSNATNTGMVLATISYDKSGETVTPIKEMDGVWVAIAAAPSGQLYGIQSDVEGSGTSVKVNSSSLYKIDRLTGEATLIGGTGQLPLLTGSATIEARSGRMFWTVSPDASSSYLCEVNLNTGAATKVLDFDDCKQVVGLYAPAPPAEDDAPAEVTDAVAAFNGGSLSGKLQFKAPSTLYNGTPASGVLTYTVLLNGNEFAKGETSFGSTVSTDVTVAERGNYEFTISVANDKGPSPKVVVGRFIGFGVPLAPEGVKAAKTAADKITVSWNAVTSSSDGGYVDAAAVTYTVKRLPDEKIVSENTTATSLEDTPDVSGGMAAYSYVVSADNHGCVSEAVESNKVVCGTAVLPWQESFKTSETLSFFTVIDANKDGKTWEYASGVVRVKYGNVKMDDWLMSPPLKLEAGKVYHATFKAHSSNARYPETIEAKWGAGNTVADMTNTLVEPATLSGDYETLGGFIKPAVSGVYHLGLHGISEADMYNLEVCEIKIEAGLDAGVPQAPVDLTVTADAAGEYKATVSLTAPETDISGSALTSIDRIELSRGGTTVHTFASPAPGERLTYNDVLEAGGDYVYSAVAVNGSGASIPTTVTAFVGTPVAAAPASVEITETAPGEIRLSWEKVALSADGKAINPDKVRYNIYNVTGNGAVIAENVTEIPYTFKGVEDGKQQFVQYSVSAVTDRGEGEKTSTRLIPAGTPYTDFHESYAGGKASTIYATERINYGNWAIQTDNEDAVSQDGDGGYMVMNGYFANYRGAMTTGKISLAGKKAPMLRFYSYTPDDSGLDKNKLEVLVSAAGGEWTEVLNKTVVELGAKQGWHEVTVPLGAYAGSDISLRFVATTSDRPYISTFIDNLNIDEMSGVDLAVTDIKAPEYVRTGESFTVSVALANNGGEAATGSSVELYAGDVLCKTSGGLTIDAGAETSAEFVVEMSALADKPVSYRAVVSHPDDAVTGNNTSEVVTVSPVTSSAPVPTNLTATRSGSDVILGWNAPVLATEPDATVTDDFESTAAWSHYADGWVMRDLDKAAVCGFGEVEIPGIEAGKTLASYFMFSATGIFEKNKYFAPHSGKQYLAALARFDNGTTDDWAVSPELSGNAQTVSFYARSYSANDPEKIQVLYSAGSLEPSDFVPTELNVDKVPGEWTRYEVALPQGARYFAIRSYATNSFMLMLDDVTFAPLSSGNLVLTGYNIYRNGERINEAPVTTTSYTDNADMPENSTWVVTAVYEQRESNGSNVATAITSSVDGVVSGQADISVAGGKIRISGCSGKHITVSSIDGKTVYSGVGNMVTDIPAGNGVYIVKVGDIVRKLVVRSMR